MSKKRNNEKFSLFYENPISIKNNKSYKNETIFIKGNGDVTFELKKGYNNIYIIKTSDNKKIEFDRESLLITLNDLKKYSQSQIKNLEEEQNESFSKVVNALGMLYKTGKLYELIHDDIMKIFNDIKIIIPGTIAAYFIGCSSKDNFTGTLGCNPKCAASLAPNEKDLGKYSCDDLVLIYEKDKTFSSLNQKMSSHVYLYIGPFEFKGFTKDNIKQLTDSNISNVTSIYGKADGTYGDIISSMPVDKLPLLSETENSDSTDDNWWWILLIIIIVIIILLFFLYQYKSYNNF